LSGRVGAELTSKGLRRKCVDQASFCSCVRFVQFGVGAVIATVHALLITLALLALSDRHGHENVMRHHDNDRLLDQRHSVIFDRIRENLRSMRRDSMDHGSTPRSTRRWPGPSHVGHGV